MAGGIGTNGDAVRSGPARTGPGAPVLHLGALWLAVGAPLTGTLVLLALRYAG